MYPRSSLITTAISIPMLGYTLNMFDAYLCNCVLLCKLSAIFYSRYFHFTEIIVLIKTLLLFLFFLLITMFLRFICAWISFVASNYILYFIFHCILLVNFPTDRFLICSWLSTAKKKQCNDMHAYLYSGGPV